ncbi:hypothetical protein AKJ43_00290 [candidate division MSBL1 archaeon SCGC-AAA261D19]|uniref:Uncharacterized protein n=1 Tax=candidate division MSBL1 archaeon SCGC-AAA261D19 TaxID=1698273 RepID=A0A133V8X1_9EURY|nr:hypothetical protein AKJ43_00290 [candidate division MSBL1 archaeon SCGC-AAA261D19]
MRTGVQITFRISRGSVECACSSAVAAPTLSLIGPSKSFRSLARELKATEMAAGRRFRKAKLSPSDKCSRRVVNKPFKNDLKRPRNLLEQVPMDELRGGSE